MAASFIRITKRCRKQKEKISGSICFYMKKPSQNFSTEMAWNEFIITNLNAFLAGIRHAPEIIYYPLHPCA